MYNNLIIKNIYVTYWGQRI
ncbi:hypothetical protein [Plasmodium yoelii yoelii]|uniref:Uncharacterized protein n=1 Tax=Plasmodium yoelii yoelii TaxID=73239 RepID=Q7REE1_PLAYO|nr:hypothetical protein [Plasmodium yoelii yoelii]